MRKMISGILLAALAVLPSCSHHNSGFLKLQVNPMFGSSALKPNTTYSAGGKYYNFEYFQIYLSHIRLLRADGSYAEVCPIAYISTGEVAPNPVASALTVSLGDSLGTFTAIQFSIGLDSIQDATNNSNLPNSDPLSINNGMYWSPQYEYTFVRLDGTGDTLANPQNYITYHVGMAPYYTTVTLTKALTMTSGSQEILNLNVDIEKIFYSGNNPINVFTQSRTATTDYPAVAAQFMTDLSQSFSIQ